MEERKKNATIIFRQDLTPELAIIRLSPDDSFAPEFVAGQYAEIAIPNDHPAPQDPEHTPKFIRRPYSIASAPWVRDYLEFFIVLVPKGELTPTLWDCHVGDRVWLGPKVKGKFTLEHVEKGKDLILVSTGTGLAPFISMVREFPSFSANKSPWRNVVIIHCSRISADLGYREELEVRAKEEKNFFYIPTVTREPESSSWTGERGRVQALFEPAKFQELTGIELKPEECQVMMCGNPEMIDSLQTYLETLNFRQHSKKNPGNIHFERYW